MEQRKEQEEFQNEWAEGLLVVERMLLESLERGEKNLDEIVEDTGLMKGLLANLVPGLVHRKIITLRGSRYRLNKEMKQFWLPVVNKRENVQEEMREMFSTLVGQKFANLEKNAESLRVQKIWLTSEEERLLESQLKSLEMFIQNIREKRKRTPLREREVTQEKKVIFWGQTSYSDLVKGTLEACWP